MIYDFNKKGTLEKRRYLRNNATKAERILWDKLKGKGLLGYKFRRQHSVGKFIMDFYCPELQIAIEVDGESHESEKSKKYDKEREDYIKTFGVKFIRIKNDTVYNNIESAVKYICESIKIIVESNNDIKQKK